MLSLIVFLPLAVAALLAVVPASAGSRVFTVGWVCAAAADAVLVLAAWIGYEAGTGMALEQRVPWIPGAGVSYHVGVDGLSLPLLGLTAGLFLACAVYSLRGTSRPKGFVLLFLLLQTVSLGVFTALDLILFFVYFDLSIVGMYFVISGWGLGGSRAAALKFFLYTFLGSLALLLGFIGLYLAVEPHTFDMVDIAAAAPLSGKGALGAPVLAAIGLGLLIKTPAFPFHTWMPPAHTDAPAAGSVILAGVLLKMGTYGFVRVAMPLLPEAWSRYAWVFVVLGVVSVLYGALVALAQEDFKRMVAYTSVNHMGYVVLAVGAAGLVAGGQEQARSLAVTGAVTQMVSHGLLTGALFLLAGALHSRAGSHRTGDYSGLAAAAPVFAGTVAVTVFASLGIPGFSGFIAEFQIFTGGLATATVATALALPGILITAALLLRALHRLCLGQLRVPDPPGGARGFPDLRAHECLAILPLLGAALLLGILPRLVLGVIEPAAVELVGVLG
ncbi:MULTISPECIES: complex I subunit 4 family protein [Actinopolyspora]|uniref:NADH-quinone oxidoreductase subunit M n=1 Tax=Actinopolyspora saharensis TaxID=995062 RepID=A0A1H0ZFS6_9ACTN|nr:MULTISPECIES: NADH-quinone oxidoreductase subunit M [Actinopolyspora]NHD15816.1 NADH-quinone oxidoreductase subunit M [Actinopolyspora sp. BKK2]NHE74970.1 NADH-quinone oxidoreductase subunit M [Actinopolyspora sp. BKK1]SDQ26242.1 NADH-quinone oxidoreductase subunit M [Actinopolyspora saharensis]